MRKGSDMAGKAWKAAVAAATAMALIAAGCAQPQQGPLQPSSESRADAPSHPALASGTGDGSPASGRIEAEWLDDGQKDGLAAALAGYFGEGADLRVVGGPETVGQATVTYVEDLGSGGFYEARLYPGDRWAIGPLHRLVEGVNAQGRDEPDEQLDQTSALTAREATFDARNCVSASNEEALADVLGARCAAAFPGLLGEFLEGRGAPGVTARDIMVERGASHDGERVSFKALAVSGNDRIIVACEWDGAEGALSAEVLG